jgi:hypothetical protein
VSPVATDQRQPAARPLRLCASETARENPLALLSWQPQSASMVWTRREWTALCEHLHNDNPAHHFILSFRGADGAKRYVRSKNLTVHRAIDWAWGSIAGSPKSRLAFSPYASNERQQSRWGGLDFDAHDGAADRARELALAAFRVLLNAPGLAVILETSGSGGWHVWAVSPEFHATGDWVRLLKKVVETIGTVIADGVCEIFPPDSLPSRFGRGMRAPGCWNPATDSCSEIVWENTRSSLESVLSGNRKTAPLICSNLRSEFPDNRNKFISLSSNFTQFIQRLGITTTGTRNQRLARLCGELFFQVGHATAQALAQSQFRGATVKPKATEGEHLASFEKLWAGLLEKWTAELSETEREILARLETENERDAFRIIRSFARKAEQDSAADFPIVRDSLAARLLITGKGAAKIRDKLARLGAIEKTADYVPNKFAARFKWLPRGTCSQRKGEIK